MGHRLLLVEDELGLRTTLVDRLSREGYQVQAAADGAVGLEMARGGEFDVIVLDIMLPKRSGFDVCRDLRQLGVMTPILMLTARGDTLDKVLGLKIGADDYMTKPFETIELLARLESLLRRAAPRVSSANGTHRFGSVHVDFRRAEVTKAGTGLALSAKEFGLLRYLLEHRGAVLSRDELLKEVWGYDEAPNSRTVDVHMAWLRQKLEDDPKNPQWLRTVIGLGYKFAD